MKDELGSLQAALADRYAIERELGAGGMATVYLARDLRHQRRVAIKVLRPELAAALGPDRFLREIATTANLHHPHILPLYDSGEAGGFLFYVMPFVEGESLRDRLDREKQLPLDEALQIAREVADALSYAHSADPAVILRDDWVTAYEDLTVPFHRFERDYIVALVLIHLGRIIEARQLIGALVSFDSMPGLGHLQRDAVRSLEAEIQLHQGDSAQALMVLRAITYEAPHSATYHAFADGSRSRFLRAELELARGDTAVARGLYQGFDESWSPWDMYHRPLALQRLGEIAAAQGRVPDAIRYYSRLVELWRDCDAALAPRRDAIARRRDALRRGG
jgi:tetratricopeptide (TPR) repeat protein